MEREPFWEQLVATARDFPNQVADLPVWQRPVPGQLRAWLRQRYDFSAPVDLEVVQGDVVELLRRWTVHATHPRYFGLFNPPVYAAGVVAEALAAVFNPQLAVRAHAAAAAQLERHTLDYFSGLLGLPPATTASTFTSGGAEANLSAVLAALAQHYPDAGRTGLMGLAAQPAVYVTEQTHHSFVKIARMTGLGTASLRRVPLTGAGTMDAAGLATQLRQDRAAGWHPLLVVATAGATSTGAIDPLADLAEVAAAGGAWYHVDAAWGGAVVLSPRLRGLVRGIHQADSVTWDAHKWLAVPMGAGMFFCRHREAVRRAFGVAAPYLPGGGRAGGDEPCRSSVQWSRRAIGLKVFMTLATLGEAGYARQIERQVELGDQLRARLRAAGWVVANQTPLPLVCCTHASIRAGRVRTADVLRAVYARGLVWLSDVSLGGRERVLRACITNFRTTDDDLAVLVEELQHGLEQGAGQAAESAAASSARA